MTALSIQPTFPTFTGADGQPLENGYIWVGTANLNPITNPITVYWDAALSAPATQPIRTLGGYPSNSGTPARLYVNSDYSIQVLDRKGSVVYSAPVATDRYGGGIINANIVVYDQSGTGAVALTVQSKLRESVVASAKGFGAVGDNTTDDSAALNAMFVAGAGGTIELEPGKTYKCLSTLTIRGDATKIKGNGAAINSYATGSAITFALVGGTRYPYNIDLQDLSLNAYGVGSYGLRVLTSYSTFRRVSVGIPAANTSGRGFALVGDETNGTGPYYNTFVNCDAQSGSAGLDHIGFAFSAAAPNYLTPNANTFIGCRAGQCLVNWQINGSGNTFNGLIAEGSAGVGTSVKFLADTATNCQDNHIFGGYVEGASKAFDFTALASYNSVTGIAGTGVTTWKTDAGTGNAVNTSNSAWSMPTGILFPIASSDVNALDYYGEGTWTPVATSVTTNSGSPVWTGTYTRIGNTVHAHIKQVGGNITTVAGASYVTLPFTASLVEWGYFGDSGLTIGSGGCATYGNLLYFATALTASVVTASITFRV